MVLKQQLEKTFLFKREVRDTNYSYIEPSLNYLSSCHKNHQLNFLDWTAAVPITKPRLTALLKGKFAFSNYNMTRHSAFIGENKLLQAIQNYFVKSGIECKKENIVVRQSIFSIIDELYHLLDPKQNKVLIPTPTFGYYVSQAKRIGIPTDLIKATEKNNWKITAKELDEKLSSDKNIRFFIFNNPVNPTGVVYNKEEVIKLAKVLKKHNIFVIADEVFKDLIFKDREKFCSIGSLDFMKDLTITLNGVGKTRGLSGLGVSFACMPEWLACRMHQDKYLSLVNIPAQIVASEVLKDSLLNDLYLNKCINKHLKNIEIIKREIDKLNKMLFKKYKEEKEYIKILIKEPQASSVMMLDFSGLYGKKFKDETIKSGLQLTKLFKVMMSIAFVPGEAYFLSPESITLRMSTSYKKKEMRDGFKRIHFILDRYL